MTRGESKAAVRRKGGRKLGERRNADTNEAERGSLLEEGRKESREAFHQAN